MAKSGHTFAKRKREQEKKAKAAAKRARRESRKQGSDVESDSDLIEFPNRDSAVDTF